MPLVEAFSLTPRESYFYSEFTNRALLACHGTSQIPKANPGRRSSFDHQHTSDEVYFRDDRARDAAADYAAYAERRRVPHVGLRYNLSAFQPHKEVALTFRFDALNESRVLVYTSAGQVADEILHPGDDQFLVEVETTSDISLNFMHVNLHGESRGGDWYFRGIDAYIA